MKIQFLMFRNILIFLFFVYGFDVHGQGMTHLKAIDTVSLLKFQQNIILPVSPNQSYMTRRIYQHEISPFFCKIEHRMNRNNKVPIFFRLGSKEYVDRLEGK